MITTYNPLRISINWMHSEHYTPFSGHQSWGTCSAAESWIHLMWYYVCQQNSCSCKRLGVRMYHSMTLKNGRKMHLPSDKTWKHFYIWTSFCKVSWVLPDLSLVSVAGNWPALTCFPWRHYCYFECHLRTVYHAFDWLMDSAALLNILWDFKTQHMDKKTWELKIKAMVAVYYNWSSIIEK